MTRAPSDGERDALHLSVIPDVSCARYLEEIAKVSAAISEDPSLASMSNWTLALVFWRDAAGHRNESKRRESE
jgi:hypothetical protein